MISATTTQPCENVPDPASLRAATRGCTCPREINYFGQGMNCGYKLAPNGRRWYTVESDCPLHGGETSEVTQ